VRIIKVRVTPEEAGYFKIEASIQNKGYLPTNVTQQSIRNKTAKTVKVTISLINATMVSGKEKVDIGHLPGNTMNLRMARQTLISPSRKVEWMVKATGKGKPTAVIKVISEKGGTDTKKITLTK